MLAEATQRCTVVYYILSLSLAICGKGSFSGGVCPLDVVREQKGFRLSPSVSTLLAQKGLELA